MNQFLQTLKNLTTVNSILKRKPEGLFMGGPEKPPHDLQPKDVRNLVGKAAAKSTDIVMKSYFFLIKGEIFKQSDGLRCFSRISKFVIFCTVH